MRIAEDVYRFVYICIDINQYVCIYTYRCSMCIYIYISHMACDIDIYIYIYA